MVRIRKGDEVLIIAGKDKGSRGKVLRVLRDKDRVVVEGLNQVQRHTKPTQGSPQGGIVTKSAPLHLSNVMLIDPESGDPTFSLADNDWSDNEVEYVLWTERGVDHTALAGLFLLAQVSNDGFELANNIIWEFAKKLSDGTRMDNRSAFVISSARNARHRLGS